MVSWESLEAFCGPQVFVLGVSWELLCVLEFLERCLEACSGRCGGVVELLGASRSLFGEYLGSHSGAIFDFLRASTPIFITLICTYACIYVCMYVYMYVYLNDKSQPRQFCLVTVASPMHICMYLRMYVCMYLCINDNSQPRHFCLVTAVSDMHTCMYSRTFVCIYVFISQ